MLNAEAQQYQHFQKIKTTNNLINPYFLKKINKKKEGFCERMTNNDTSRYKSTYFKIL